MSNFREADFMIRGRNGKAYQVSAFGWIEGQAASVRLARVEEFDTDPARARMVREEVLSPEIRREIREAAREELERPLETKTAGSCMAVATGCDIPVRRNGCAELPRFPAF